MFGAMEQQPLLTHNDFPHPVIKKNIDKQLFLVVMNRLSINPNALGSYQIRDIKHYTLTLALSENMPRAQCFCFFLYLAS
jgi:hypothetical protein